MRCAAGQDHTEQQHQLGFGLEEFVFDVSGNLLLVLIPYIKVFFVCRFGPQLSSRAITSRPEVRVLCVDCSRKLAQDKVAD